MKSLLFFTGFLALLFSSCTTQMYVSNAVNAPLLKEKGEVKINVTQNDLQFSAALADHFALMANGFYKSHKDDNRYEHRGTLGEIGVGYYANTNSHLVFEAFMGVGAGTIYKQQQFYDVNESMVLGKFSAGAGRLFIQPDVGYRSKVFDLVFTPRFSFVKYTRFEHENYSTAQLQNDYLNDNNLTGPLFIFAEPALTLRVGYKFIKVQAQYGLTLNMGGSNIRHPANFSSLGLVLDIAKWYNE